MTPQSNSFVKQKITPEELSVRIITKNWKNILSKLDEKEQDKIQTDLTNVIHSAIQLERCSTDKFIELTQHEVGVVSYYISLLDRIKFMAADAFLENSKKKRDMLLIEMSKILGANVVEETIPVPYKIKEPKSL